MKKILILTMGSTLLLSSCKKDYTCECTYTHTETGGENPHISTYDYKVNYTDIKKKHVESHDDCISTEENYTSEQFQGFDPVTSQYIYETVYHKESIDCKITK